MQLAINTFHNLTKTGGPAAQVFEPSRLSFGITFRRTQNASLILIVPALLIDTSFKAAISDIKAVRSASHGSTAWVWAAAGSQEVFGQRLLFGIAWAKTKSGNDALRINRKQQTKPSQTSPDDCDMRPIK